jgi:hypothetical protein
VAAERLTPDIYVVAILLTAGLVVVVASLLAIPAVRELRESSKRWVPIATAIAALVLPVVIGGQSLARYVDSLDDFTSAPDICESDVLTETRVAELIPDPPVPDTESDDDDVFCTWTASGVELHIELNKEDDSRTAADRLRKRQENREQYGTTVTPLPLGDKGIRYPSDELIDAEDALGTTVMVRFDNLVLELTFAQPEELGTPSSAEAEALAAELVRELEPRQPDRWTRPLFTSS